MGALSNAANLAQDNTFRNQALAALVTQAHTVATEDPATARHQLRAIFAQAVIGAPSRFLDVVAWVVACDPAVASMGSQAAQITETALLTSVSNAWNYLAGLYTQPPT